MRTREHRPVRARWAAGEPAFAAWLLLESPAAAPTVASAGFDAAVIDLQHGHATLADLPGLIAEIEGPTLSPSSARLEPPAELMRALDLGFRGVICPMVGSRAEAEAFVAACRYRRRGTRSYGPLHAAFGQGRDQTGAADAAILLFAMIETADGLANLDEIADTPGLDGLFVGPSDLQPRDGSRDVRRPHRPGPARTLDAIVDAANPTDPTGDPRALPTARRRDGGARLPVRLLRGRRGPPRGGRGDRSPRHPRSRVGVSPMKLRSLVLLVTGVVLGMKLAAKLREDDPNVVHGPQRQRSDQARALRLVSGQVHASPMSRPARAWTRSGACAARSAIASARTTPPPGTDPRHPVGRINPPGADSSGGTLAADAFNERRGSPRGWLAAPGPSTGLVRGRCIR